ncbi:hypothetical protein PV797_04220 [Clostridiaceae bacterium M8S5]|nr:hypothetical protein PV797_04220 [Clostridiaceae bacterium M8S5]
MKKLFKQSTIIAVLILTVMVTNITAFASGNFVNGDFSSNLTIPTYSSAYVDGSINRTIFAGAEKSKAKPWVFADVKLTSVRTQNDKVNYGVLALKRAIAYFQDQNQHLKNNDYFIILNNGFIINKTNYNNQEVFDQAKKTLLDNESYLGDTIFTVAFLSGENKVVKQSMWKLIDMINLAPGSSFTSNTNFNVGISTQDQLTLSETLGLKTADKMGANLGITKSATLGALAEINTEINENLARTFNFSNQVNAQKTENVTVKHSATKNSMLVLRYQLVDNINVDLETFYKITKDLQNNMNMGGRDIVETKPASGASGIDIPSNVIFDVIINQ